MKKIKVLNNVIQEYGWGSHNVIPELLGQQVPSEKPQAELWMGSHPKASSEVEIEGRRVSLLKLIEKNPEDILGQKVALKFNNKLPYLFKVLAAAKPLSIQAHPNKSHAQAGFARENMLGVPINAPNRNYKDDNHKPECICALTPFWALNGFRKISKTILLMEKICPLYLLTKIDLLRKQPDSAGLKLFFKTLMTMDSKTKKQAIDDTLANINAKNLCNDDLAFKWMINLSREYPDDIGIFFPVLLNLVCLKPGQAMFLPAGELHAYLEGAGIELMANSDNVLRGGLTGKHIDVSELIKILNFKERKIDILTPEKTETCESKYPSLADEFVLSVIITDNKEKTYTSVGTRSVEIILCTDGEAVITEIGRNSAIPLLKGTSVVIPAAVERYSIHGAATLYKAAVPV